LGEGRRKKLLKRQERSEPVKFGNRWIRQYRRPRSRWVDVV